MNATVEGEDTVVLSFTWPSILLNPTVLMNSILSFCSDMEICQGTLLMQGIMGFIEQFQQRKGDKVTSTCRIKLTFPVKQDFSEDVLTFEGTGIVLYVLRFAAPERHFAIKSTRIAVHKITPYGGTPTSGTVVDLCAPDITSGLEQTSNKSK